MLSLRILLYTPQRASCHRVSDATRLNLSRTTF